MQPFRKKSALVAILAALSAPLAFAVFAQAPAAAESGERSAPKLVVVVSIDQFRGDYVHRFEGYYGNDGFKRIFREGFDYQDCLYASANTETGPGHSTMLTGTYAHRSGIAQNNWFELGEMKSVYCVQDSATTAIASAGGVADRDGSFSPHRLLAGTVGDNLEAATGGAAKTLSISLKDRAAILMGGHAADLALWFDHSTGEFVSSSYYVKSLPKWLVDFNTVKPRAIDQWFKKSWDLSVAAKEYARLCTPDDYPSEGRGGYEGIVFPHVLGRGNAPSAGYYNALYASPFGNDALVELLKAAIPGMELGQDDTPDLLTLSFSSNDPIGHAFGPDSWEVMDATIKTDGSLANLMKLLDEKIGKGEWSLFLTADHGVLSFPEVLEDMGIDAKRISSGGYRSGLEKHLREIAGSGPCVAGFDPPWVTFDPAVLKTPGMLQKLTAASVDWLTSQPDVQLAMPSADLLTRDLAGDDILRALRNSYYPGRTGDVAVVFKPNYLLGNSRTGTSHGTVYRYDQYVPLLALGKGIKHGHSAARVEPLQIAPSAAILLNVVPPNLCEVPPLAEALGD